jgi:hypothetical protein
VSVSHSIEIHFSHVPEKMQEYFCNSLDYSATAKCSARRKQKKNITKRGCNLEQIEPVHVRQYPDRRGATAKVRANRERGLLSHI